jgi:hypothetical protein
VFGHVGILRRIASFIPDEERRNLGLHQPLSSPLPTGPVQFTSVSQGTNLNQVLVAFRVTVPFAPGASVHSRTKSINLRLVQKLSFMLQNQSQDPDLQKVMAPQLPVTVSTMVVKAPVPAHTKLVISEIEKLNGISLATWNRNPNLHVSTFVTTVTQALGLYPQSYPY